MAIRIHVTAVRDCPAEELRAALAEELAPSDAAQQCAPGVETLPIVEHDGWSWCITSVWGVRGGDLNKSLCRLARPALQFTTSDGDRWYVTIHGGPEGQAYFLHEFSYHSADPDPAEDMERLSYLKERDAARTVDPRLAFLEDDPAPGARRTAAPFDLIADALADLGYAVPQAFRDEVSHLPYSQAATRYRQYHADRVCAALEAAGIPFERDAVQDALLWRGTERDYDSDLGNLPHLLVALGLGGDWEKWVAGEDETESRGDAALADAEPGAPAPEPIDLIRRVWNIVEPIGLEAVSGGPYTLPMDQIDLLRFLPESLTVRDTAGLSIRVTLPPDQVPAAEDADPGEHAGQVECLPDGFVVGLPNHMWCTRKELEGALPAPLSGLLFSLPDGAVVDLAFALDRNPGLNQRYRGPVVNGRWHIAESYPLITSDALSGALKLARDASRGAKKHRVRDTAEAEAIVALAARDPQIGRKVVEHDDRNVWCDGDLTGRLAGVLFRHRYGTLWSTAGYDAEAGRQMHEHREMRRKLRGVSAEAARGRAAPHSSDIVLRGKTGIYWRADMAGIAGLEQETRERIDRQMAELGFQHVGDLVAKKQRDIVLRAYAAEDRLSYGTLLAKKTMYLGWDFFSRFTDGSTLTSSTNASSASRPNLKVYYRDYPGLEPAALLQKHHLGISRFREHKGAEAVRLDATLLGVATEMDRALARRDAVSQSIRITSVPAGEAPLEVRKAWVGCVLPLFADSEDDRVSNVTKGILSQKKRGRAEGFAVAIPDAIEALALYNATAAQWWREHIPHLIRPGKLMLFATNCCELAD